MTLKTKISFITASLFTVMFGIAVTIIYILFANFRKEEFENRLKEKAVNSIKLLVEVKQFNKKLLQLIDQNTINELYDEKTLIFDADYNLIYSSLDDAKITWSIDDLYYLKEHKTFFKKELQRETYGAFYDTNQKDYFALISASDNYGKRKLQYLLYILISAYIVFTTICWVSVFYSVKVLLTPLNQFLNKVKGINENNLHSGIEVTKNKDEIALLANEFNMMLHRIDESYQKQKEFTANASHELRTPIARLTSQIENRIFDTATPEESKTFLKRILQDVNQLSELTSSLLLLSKLSAGNLTDQDKHRIDELIFEAVSKINKTYPNFKVALEIEDKESMDLLMEVKGSKSLLEIMLINLLKNACIYSLDQQAFITISEQGGRLKLSITNNGKTLNTADQKNMFASFMRGTNSKGKTGLGLGLGIVQRILNEHKATIQYETPAEDRNVFTIIFAS